MTVRSGLLVLALFAQTVAIAKPVRSTIEDVTVYPSGATITRTATVSLVAGTNQLELVGLVDDLDADSLRVEIENGDVRIGQVSLEREQERDVTDEEIATVQGEIDAVNDEIRILTDSTEAAKLQLTFLRGIATGYSQEAGTDGMRGAADTNTWKDALTLLSTGSAEANRTIRNNEAKGKELVKDLSVLTRRLGELRGGALSSTVVTLDASASRPLQTEIRLHYYLEAANWQPKYEARLDSNSGALQLAQQASVSQETDEDWTNVRLTLSTSEPSGELMAPELESEFLNIYRPQPRRESKVARTMASPGFSDQMIEEVVVTGTKIRADVGGFAVNYDVPGRTSISNDADDGALIDLAKFNFATTLVTRVVPRQNTQAFLTARFMYDKNLPLYGSDMTVFVDGAFAGYSEMPTALPQSEVVLPVGQDRRIEVSAKTQGGEGGRGGIISKRKTEVTDYLFELTNRRSSPSDVEVFDRYPVARDKDIDVDVPKSATEPDERDVDDKPGVVVWKKTLGPGETWQIRHQYSVSYPAQAVLQTQ